ncbi:SGNH hydrolase [Rhizoclosmatium globosum]|uniref:SGNH hydrolase n=1 Tax=Rhizoclosmatium globosum TaxID=329046 RepID=A0A1Y2CAJ3_9FUNG|nr:SGNH hydrolase [Rhizoclosmatium globosum]|eukprot:ORY44051.1 SGNH hydrolase [Rhizoclosmatium globosum]
MTRFLLGRHSNLVKLSSLLFLTLLLVYTFLQSPGPTKQFSSHKDSYAEPHTSSQTTPHVEDWGYDQILLLGDSLTEFGSLDATGWALNLSRRYSRKMTVSARGFSGYNSYWLNLATPRLLNEFPTNRTKLVVLMIGTNDSVLKGRSPQHVSIDRYQHYLNEISKNIRQITRNARILMVTPPPISSPVVFDYYTFESMKQYRVACLNAFERIYEIEGDRVAVLDMWELFGGNQTYLDPNYDPKSLDTYFSDGLHFKGKGHELMYKGVLSVIETKWPELNADNMSVRLASNFLNAPAEELGDDEAASRWMFGGK